MNLLILLHGITPDQDESLAKAGAAAAYETFLTNLDGALRREGSSLGALFPDQNILKVFWGLPHGGLVQDAREEKLAQAETRVQRLTGGDRDGWGLNPVSWMVRQLKQGVVTQGLADAVYYASAQGEPLVRLAVFGQILEKILARADAEGEPVRLHIVCHSLGVTVAHDLLFYLFNRTRGYKPLILKPGALKGGAKARRVQKLLEVGRAMAQRGQIRLGSYHALASQLSLFCLRKANFIPGLAAGKPYFNLPKLGVQKQGGVQLQFFYDPSDLLGLPSAELYVDKDKARHIREFRIWNWAWEGFYHTGYWGRKKVGRKIAEVLLQRIAAA